jgi:hypothetical protein
MMNIELLDDRILEAIANNQDCLDNPEPKLKYMSVDEAFDAFLTWHGIIGYSHMIRRALENIKEACNE